MPWGSPSPPPGTLSLPTPRCERELSGCSHEKEEPELQLSREGEKCVSVQLVHSILKMFQMSGAGLRGPPAGSWLGGVTAAAFQVRLSQARFGSGSLAPSGRGAGSGVASPEAVGRAAAGAAAGVAHASGAPSLLAAAAGTVLV